MEQIISINYKHEAYEFNSHYRDAITRDKMPIEAINFCFCYHCHRALDVLYAFVLYKLDRAGLLYKDFLPLCCMCKISLKYMGKIRCRCGRYYQHGYFELNGKEMIAFYCDDCDFDIYYDVVPDD